MYSDYMTWTTYGNEMCGHHYLIAKKLQEYWSVKYGVLYCCSQENSPLHLIIVTWLEDTSIGHILD